MSHKFFYKLLSMVACLGLFVFPLAGAGQAAGLDDGEVDLVIGLKVPLHTAPGGTLVANLSYSNAGTLPSPDDTLVKLVLPVGVSFLSAMDKDGLDLPPDEESGNELIWIVDALPAGSCCAHVWVTVEVAKDLAEGTLLTFKGEISSSADENNLDNNVIEVSSEVCDMAGSTKQAQSGQVKPGDVVTYTIMLRLAARNGPAVPAERQVILTDDLPPAQQVRFLGWVNTPSGTYDGAQLRWQGQVSASEPVMLQYRLGIEGDVPPGTVITNKARIQWAGGEMELEPVDVQVYLTEDDHMFGPDGGQWQHAYGMTLNLPQYAVQEMTRFQFRPLFEDKIPGDTPPGWIYAHRAFEMNAFHFGEIHQFNQPITVTISYNPQEIPALVHQTLRLWYRNGPGEPWAMLGEPVAHQYGQIHFVTDHFTEFALFGQMGYSVFLPLIKH